MPGAPSCTPSGRHLHAPPISTQADLTAHFRGYIRVLNQHLWSGLATYLSPRVVYNGRKMRADALANVLVPPGASVSAEFVVVDMGKRMLAARVDIEAPTALGSSPGSTSPTMDEDRRGSGSSTDTVREHVFYHFDNSWRIDEVWSVTERPERLEEGPKRFRPVRQMSTQGFDAYHM